MSQRLGFSDIITPAGIRLLRLVLDSTSALHSRARKTHAGLSQQEPVLKSLSLKLSLLKLKRLLKLFAETIVAETNVAETNATETIFAETKALAETIC